MISPSMTRQMLTPQTPGKPCRINREIREIRERTARFRIGQVVRRLRAARLAGFNAPKEAQPRTGLWSGTARRLHGAKEARDPHPTAKRRQIAEWHAPSLTSPAASV